MSYIIEKAKPEDTDELAKAVVSGLEPEILKVQGGDNDEEKMIAAISGGLKMSIENPNHIVLVARDEDTGAAVSVADWALPLEDMHIPATEEEMNKDIENRRKHIPPGMNEAFMVENWTQMYTMIRESLKGRKCYHISSLATVKAHRGKGLATKLVQWPLEQADKEGEVAFLTTDETNPARRIYERAGFKVVGEISTDFAKYGSPLGTLKRVAMLREPRKI